MTQNLPRMRNFRHIGVFGGTFSSEASQDTTWWIDSALSIPALLSHLAQAS